MALWTILAEFSDDDDAWFVRASDMPGLHVDARTFDDLARKAGEHILTLLEINDDLLDADQKRAPHSVKIIAHHERSVPIAA